MVLANGAAPHPMVVASEAAPHPMVVASGAAPHSTLGECRQVLIAGLFNLVCEALFSIAVMREKHDWYDSHASSDWLRPPDPQRQTHS